MVNNPLDVKIEANKFQPSYQQQPYQQPQYQQPIPQTPQHQPQNHHQQQQYQQQQPSQNQQQQSQYQQQPLQNQQQPLQNQQQNHQFISPPPQQRQQQQQHTEQQYDTQQQLFQQQQKQQHIQKQNTPIRKHPPVVEADDDYGTPSSNAPPPVVVSRSNEPGAKRVRIEIKDDDRDREIASLRAESITARANMNKLADHIQILEVSNRESQHHCIRYHHDIILLKEAVKNATAAFALLSSTNGQMQRINESFNTNIQFEANSRLYEYMPAPPRPPLAPISQNKK
jgi:hypothetical protein